MFLAGRLARTATQAAHARSVLASGGVPRATHHRAFCTASRGALAGKKFDPSAVSGQTSTRLRSTSARARRQQRRSSPAAGTPKGSSSSSATTASTGAAPRQQQRQASQHGRAGEGADMQGKRTARGRPQIGRFNRIAGQKGLAFASYLYVIGESMTLLMTYLIHTNTWGIGEVGSWLTAAGAGGFVEGYVERGPTVLGVRLSPRLFVNYLIANAFTYPLYNYQYAFCAATAPIFARATAPLREKLRAARKSKSAIPKAPSATPQ